MQDLISSAHVVAGLYPVADAFAGGVATDVISLANYRRATFIISTGAIEDANISNVVTVEACTSAAAAGATAMAFRSRVCASSTTVDTWGALTARSASGHNFATANAVANAIWMIDVTAEEVAAAVSGGQFVRVAIAETANKTITASCIVILTEPRFPGATPITAIA